ncbi:MAG: hypothetical protein AB3N13_02145 [Arenibacterium sp.]
MFSELKSALFRSHQTLLPDAIGLVALVVMLLVALHLPGMI